MRSTVPYSTLYLWLGASGRVENCEDGATLVARSESTGSLIDPEISAKGLSAAARAYCQSWSPYGWLGLSEDSMKLWCSPGGLAGEEGSALVSSPVPTVLNGGQPAARWAAAAEAKASASDVPGCLGNDGATEAYAGLGAAVEEGRGGDGWTKIMQSRGR